MCARGCVDGMCTSPGVCQCQLGFVGRNCSTQCSCNKHSTCAGVNEPDVCLECHNNTIVSACGQTHAVSTVCPCPLVMLSPFPVSRISTVRSVSLCMWAPPRGAALVVHVRSSAVETVLCVYPETIFRRPLRTHSSSPWTSTA